MLSSRKDALEKQALFRRQPPEALREIDDYYNFCLEMGRKANLETIAKREVRLKKKTLQAD